MDRPCRSYWDRAEAHRSATENIMVSGMDDCLLNECHTLAPCVSSATGKTRWQSVVQEGIRDAQPMSSDNLVQALDGSIYAATHGGGLKAIEPQVPHHTAASPTLTRLHAL